eukprot:1700033-Rhodomonas_salina.1
MALGHTGSTICPRQYHNTKQEVRRAIGRTCSPPRWVILLENMSERTYSTEALVHPPDKSVPEMVPTPEKTVLALA